VSCVGWQRNTLLPIPKPTQQQVILRYPLLTSNFLNPPLDTDRKHHLPISACSALVLLASAFDSVVIRPGPTPTPNAASGVPPIRVSA
jgi:hypothetical protein